MVKRSKRYNQTLEKIDVNKQYSPNDAVGMVKDNATAKFDESIEMVAEWYRNYYSEPKNISNITTEQIKRYQYLAGQRGLKWAKNF